MGASEEDERRRACARAMRLLEHADRTEKGLSGRLRQDGFSPEAVRAAVEYVKSFGYVNDARYALNYISGRLGTKSRRRILQELEQRGIGAQTAREAWEEAALLEEPDERAVIRRELERRYSPGDRIDEKEARRLYGYFARRGFRFPDVSSVMEEMELSVERYFSSFPGE